MSDQPGVMYHVIHTSRPGSSSMEYTSTASLSLFISSISQLKLITNPSIQLRKRLRCRILQLPRDRGCPHSARLDLLAVLAPRDRGCTQSARLDLLAVLASSLSCVFWKERTDPIPPLDSEPLFFAQSDEWDEGIVANCRIPVEVCCSIKVFLLNQFSIKGLCWFG